MMENLPAINLDKIEEKLLSHPQIECKTNHYFGPGLYIREVIMPAGAIVMGHSHKADSMNIMIKGKMLLLKDNEVVELSAPQTFVAGPGRKVAYIIEEVIWQNVHATEETDLDKLEDMFVDKSQGWLTHFEQEKLMNREIT